MTPEDMIEELANLGNLTRWEASFIVDIGNKLEWGRDLTETELKKLEEIYHERT